jgi:hypothetical protein
MICFDVTHTALRCKNFCLEQSFGIWPKIHTLSPLLSKAGHIVCKIAGPSDAPFIRPTKDQSGGYGFHKVMQKTINTSNSKPKLFSPKVKSFLKQ